MNTTTTKYQKVSHVQYLTAVLIVILAWGPAISVYAQNTYGNTYYVDAGRGGDSSTGYDGTTPERAFKTIQAAASIAPAGSTIYIRAGVYRETVTPVNSGVKFIAYKGEKAVVSGCDKVTGWTLYSGNIYKAPMNWDMYNGDGNIIFFNNKLMCEASWPNIAVEDFLDKSKYATIDAVRGVPVTSITDSKLGSKFATNELQGALLWFETGVKWTSFTGLVTGNGTNSLSVEMPTNIASNYNPKAGNLYRISRKLALLDVTTEWYKDVASGQLYFYAPGGVNPETGIVEARKRTYAFDLSGKSDIQIEGIEILAAQINFSKASYCTVKKSIIRTTDNNNPAKMGTLKGKTVGFAVDGSYNTIRDCEIMQMYGSGLDVSGENNSVVNNYIHDINYLHFYADGVRMDGRRFLISHNTICRFGRAGIGGTFKESVIQYNNVFDGMKLSYDGGLFYVVNTDFGGSEVHHNFFHDALGNTTGIYFDNFSFNYIVYRNMVWNVNYGALCNIPSEYALWYNNTFLSTEKGFHNWGNLKSEIGTRLYNNIFKLGWDYGGSAGAAAKASIINSNNIFNATTDHWVNSGAFDFRLKTSSAANNAGRTLIGVTENYEGSAPDIGAIEAGITWKTGHDFDNPPYPALVFNQDIQYRNRVINPGFEEGSFRGWGITGIPELATFNTWGFTDVSSKFHSYGAKLNAGDKIEQTISNLKPNTIYKLTCWARVEGLYARGGGYSSPQSNPLSLRFNDVNFGSTSALYNQMYLLLTENSGSGGKKIDIYIDAPSTSEGGTKIGTYTIGTTLRTTPSWGSAVGLSAVTGTHDVYLVFSSAGICSFSNFRLTNSTLIDSCVMGVNDSSGSATTLNVTNRSFASTPSSLTFTTGVNSTSATIYVSKPSGNYFGYVDAFGLTEAN
jgi:hypothetical protein